MARTSLGAAKIIFDENLQDIDYIKNLPTCRCSFGRIRSSISIRVT